MKVNNVTKVTIRKNVKFRLLGRVRPKICSGLVQIRIRKKAMARVRVCVHIGNSF